MGRTPKDYDVATAARPEQVQKLFKRVIPTGVQHGTVTVLTSAGPVEVTTFRTEGQYTDGRRPESVEYHGDIDADLSRRDFTINAIALDPTDKSLRDPFRGQEDLEQRIVRSVGRAEDRFSEDGLRPLRAVRLATVLGFEIEPATRNAISGSLETFRRISVERVREEFTKILLSDRAGQGLGDLQSTGMLEIFLPEVAATTGVRLPPPHRFDLFGHLIAAVDAAPALLELRLAALFHDVAQVTPEKANAHATEGARQAEKFLVRLKYPTKVIETVAVIIAEHGIDEMREWSAIDIRRLAARVGETVLDQLLVFTVANRKARASDETESLARVSSLKQRVEEVLAERPPLRPNQLALGGDDIMKLLAVGPSPIVGEATRFLMDAVLEEPNANTHTELARRLRKWAETRRA
jgi:tRNA nucleotidyltransferase (CCA-adding enzyme)